MTREDSTPDAPKKEEKKPPLADFESTLPLAGAHPPRADDLDLDVDDIQTRLPYGSEDIADK